MAREHLFRGFQPDENGTTTISLNGKQIKGEWIEGNLFIPDDPSTPTQICMGTSIIRICYDVIPETVGEFVGETDISTKKIFEGDIIRANVGEGEEEIEHLSNSRIKVEFHNGYFFPFGYRCSWRSWVNDVQVIGNIYENPELLEDKHNG